MCVLSFGALVLMAHLAAALPTMRAREWGGLGGLVLSSGGYLWLLGLAPGPNSQELGGPLYPGIVAVAFGTVVVGARGWQLFKREDREEQGSEAAERASRAASALLALACLGLAVQVLGGLIAYLMREPF